MFKPYVDFHTHSQRSDGRLSPTELVTQAYRAGIRVLAITDHNYTEDLQMLRGYVDAAFDEPMSLVQGAEISADYEDEYGRVQEVHIVALGFDPEDPELKAILKKHRPDRRPYIEKILERLRAYGIDIGTYEDICKRFPDTSFIGRMALARCLYEDGYTASVDESFDLYLGAHGQCRAYVENPLRYSSMEDVIRTVIHAGGIPILAHLLYYNLDNGERTGGAQKERLVRTFRELVDRYGGVGGMEVYYTRYRDPEERKYLLTLAEQYGLLASAGSDYHAQEEWETLDHRTLCSICSALLEHFGGSGNPDAVTMHLGGIYGKQHD